jgi:YesN/AraC family two-component response regulator
MKVMVVDDEADVRLLFEQRFRKEVQAGLIEFYFALSAREALDFIETNFIETNAEHPLILSDINMPGMSGLELLKTVKEKHVDLKVFMITAYGDAEYHRIAVAYGCDGYLTKPIDFAMLKEKLLT